MPKHSIRKRSELQGKIHDKKCYICFDDTKKCNKIKKNCTCCTTLHTYHGSKICNHSFCFKCIHKWSKENNTCPLCRKEFRRLICHQRSIKVEKPNKKFDIMMEAFEADPMLRMRFVMDYCDRNHHAIAIWDILNTSFHDNLIQDLPHVYAMVSLVREINNIRNFN